MKVISVSRSSSERPPILGLSTPATIWRTVALSHSSASLVLIRISDRSALFSGPKLIASQVR